MQQKKKLIFFYRKGLIGKPVMLLNKVELSRDESLKGLPVSGVLLPVFLAEAEKQISRENLIRRLSNRFVGNRRALWKHLVDRSLNALHPLSLVVHMIHMSGLLGLFVWKQKAITDAPDTYTATRFSIQRNVSRHQPDKSQAKKRPVRGRALSTQRNQIT
jgi:hypothetical protein